MEPYTLPRGGQYLVQLLCGIFFVPVVFFKFVLFACTAELFTALCPVL